MEFYGAIITALITSLFGPMFVEYIKTKLITKEKSTNDDPIKDEMDHAHIINEELDEIRDELNCERVWIMLYHNGGHFLTNKKSMKKFSIIYESCEINTPSIGMVFNSIPVTLFSRATQEIIENKRIFIYDFEDPKTATFGLKNMADVASAKSHYRIGLFDFVSNQCMGALGIDFATKIKLTKEKELILESRTQRIAGYLSNAIKHD